MEIQHQLHYPLYSNLLATGQYSHYTNNQIENSTIYSDILTNPVTMVGTGNLPSLSVNSNQEFSNHPIHTPLSNENFFNTSSISLANGGENISSTLFSTETYQPLAKIDNSNISLLNVSY
ncbi:Hypothetical protein SRAE_0000018900 [Strongyloides ratti]|uniref:Uncharacterized protein n=1 Tax=Strongyloides ratti TaxID=34506 RepID=A0A090L0N6_STRRB|nr:Hypothetical protein SRAE_0000018900 [Strongyloides ratti]CEF61059.1 Hypothetical protein SRAE_0000018900 [Strongyloides ratti]